MIHKAVCVTVRECVCVWSRIWLRVNFGSGNGGEWSVCFGSAPQMKVQLSHQTRGISTANHHGVYTPQCREHTRTHNEWLDWRKRGLLLPYNDFPLRWIMSKRPLERHTQVSCLVYCSKKQQWVFYRETECCLIHLDYWPTNEEQYMGSSCAPFRW